MKRAIETLSVPLLLANVVGCAQIVGIEEWSATASGAGGATSTSTSTSTNMSVSATGDSSASTGTGATCGQCVPAEPVGWSGPILIRPGLTVADCPSGTTLPFVGHTGFDAPGTCHGCACTPNPGNCSPATLNHGSGCGTAEGLTPGMCTVTMLDTKELSAGASNQMASSCGLTSGSAPILDPVTWKEDFVACAPTPSTSTNDCAPGTERCLPKVDHARVCVFQEGDQPDCPPGLYSFRDLLHTSVADNRACNACNCGVAATGVSCSGVISVFPTANCSGMPLNSVTTQTACNEGLPGTALSLRFDPTNLGACVAPQPSAMGSATPTGPITLCCTTAD